MKITARSDGSRGFTLTEVMAAMLIASMVLAAVAATYTSSVRGFTRNRELAQTQMRARVSLDFVAQEFRNAGHLVNWDQAPPVGLGSLDTIAPIAGAAPMAGTDFITLRYTLGPIPARAATLANPLPLPVPPFILTVDRIDLDGDATNGNEITAGSLVAIYVPPMTVNLRRVQATPTATTITLDPAGPGVSPALGVNSFVAVVQETSFWIEQVGGIPSLMMRSTGDATNRTLAANVEDLQLVFLNANGALTVATDPNVRAVRLGLTARSARTVQDRAATIPPNLEDHNRGAEAPDQFLRRVEQTTVYLRNYGVLG